jgi:hypothetical protein
MKPFVLLINPKKWKENFSDFKIKINTALTPEHLRIMHFDF